VGSVGNQGAMPVGKFDAVGPDPIPGNVSVASSGSHWSSSLQPLERMDSMPDGLPIASSDCDHEDRIVAASLPSQDPFTVGIQRDSREGPPVALDSTAEATASSPFALGSHFASEPRGDFTRMGAGLATRNGMNAVLAHWMNQASQAEAQERFA